MLPTAVVVDDDALLRQCTVETVAECGFDVLEAATCDTALNMLEERKGAVAFVVTDVRMPGRLDGMDFARLVAGRWPWIRILVISGYEDDRTSRLPATQPSCRDPGARSTSSILSLMRGISDKFPRSAHISAHFFRRGSELQFHLPIPNRGTCVRPRTAPAHDIRQPSTFPQGAKL